MSKGRPGRHCVVLVHHQYRLSQTGPWITHKVDAFGPSYDLEIASLFAAKAALEAPRQRWTLGADGSAAQVNDRMWVVSDGDNRRSIVEAQRLQPTKGRVRQAWSNIRTWLGDKPVRPSVRSAAA